MKTLSAKVKPTPNLNSRVIEVNFRDYEIERGLIFEYKILNEAAYTVNAGQVVIGGQDWQDWAPGTPESDEQYILDKVCERVGVERAQEGES